MVDTNNGMKWIAASIAALLLLSACSDPPQPMDGYARPLDAYRSPIDRFLASANGAWGLPDPCSGKRIDLCFNMTEPQKYNGIWVHQAPDYDRFFKDAKIDCFSRGRLTFLGQLRVESLVSERVRGAMITFVGRKTKYGDDYIVDRLLERHAMNDVPVCR